jgi:hypothetical protein
VPSRGLAVARPLCLKNVVTPVALPAWRRVAYALLSLVGDSRLAAGGTAELGELIEYALAPPPERVGVLATDAFINKKKPKEFGSWSARAPKRISNYREECLTVLAHIRALPTGANIWRARTLS